MKHFNQDKLTHGDINCALEDQNELSKLNGMKEPYQNKYIKNARTWELENKRLDILQEIKSNLRLQDLRATHPIGIEFDWLSIGGKVPDEEENVTILNKHRVPTKQEAIQAPLGADNLDLGPVQTKDDEFKILNIKMDDNGAQLMVKEVRPNILSVEADKFLTSFFRILDEQIKTIDEGEEDSGYQKFLNGEYICAMLTLSVKCHPKELQNADPRTIHR